jgi:hypothetical protein
MPGVDLGFIFPPAPPSMVPKMNCMLSLSSQPWVVAVKAAVGKVSARVVMVRQAVGTPGHAGGWLIGRAMVEEPVLEPRVRSAARASFCRPAMNIISIECTIPHCNGCPYMMNIAKDGLLHATHQYKHARQEEGWRVWDHLTMMDGSKWTSR